MKQFRQIVNELVLVSEKRGKLQVFLVFVIVSSVLWLLIKLSDDYTINIKLPVTYHELPHDKLLYEISDEHLKLSITSRGFVIIKIMYLRNIRDIKISLSKIPYRKRSQTDYYVNTANLREWLAQQYRINESYIVFEDRELRFKLEELQHKKVPVMLNLAISYKQQYGSFDKPEIIPDSVTVYGAAKVIDTINALFTEKVNIKEAEQQITKNVALVYNTQLVRIAPTEVKVNINVERFTESSFLLPIKIPELTPGIKIFPENTSISFRVSLNDYHSIQYSDFIVALDTHGIHQNSPALKLAIVQHPEKITNVRISPDFVEYIRIRP